MRLEVLSHLLVICSLLTVPCVCLQGQSLNRMIELGLNQSHITLSHQDSIENVTLAVDTRQPKPKEIKFYYWYGNGQIKVTQGNYSGRLLHGPYVLFSRNKDLLSKGQYQYGLKSGAWQNWYSNGTLKHIGHWKKGLQHGSYHHYFADGSIHETGQYRSGKRHGKAFIYDLAGQARKVRYRKGKLIKPTSSPTPADSLQTEISKPKPSQMEVQASPGNPEEKPVQASPEKTLKKRKSLKRRRKKKQLEK